MIIVCDACGKKNRIPSKYLHSKGKCGSCGERLGPQSTPIDIKSVAEFDDIVQSSKVPVLVDFWAPWCGPCRTAAPFVKATAAKRAGKALVLKVDTDQLPELGARYNVRGIPNFVVLSAGGKLAHQKAGLVNGATMEKWLDAAR